MKNICLILIAFCGIQISLTGQFSPEFTNSTTVVDHKLSVSGWEATPEYVQWQQAFDTYFKPYVAYWFDEITTPYAVEVKNKQGEPVASVKISLINNQGTEEAHVFTGLDGKAMLWPQSDQQSYTIEATYNTWAKQLKKPKDVTSTVNTIVLKHACQQLEGADILALVDATHSMGDEFEGIMRALQGTEASVMLGRDVGERYLVKPVDVANPQTFTNQAAGGGKHEEAIEQVLLAALQQHQWDASAASRILLFFTDALPQRSGEAALILEEAIQYANQNDVRIFPVAASGLNEEGEFLLQSLALFTGGSYTWLNDNPDNLASHRIPLLSGATQSYDLTEWLKTIVNEHKHFDNCVQDKKEEQAYKGDATYCIPNPATTNTYIHFPAEVQSVIAI